jgi:predicted secreted protein
MAKYAAKGALLQYLSGSSYLTIAGVQDFTFSLGESTQIDVTSHDSSGSYSENVAGIKEHSPFTVPIVWDGAATSHAYLVTNHGSQITLKITGKESSPKTYAFAAIVQNIEYSWPVRGAQTANVTFLPTGAVTVA